MQQCPAPHTHGCIGRGGGGGGGGRDPPPLCDIPSGCCSFTGPWTVTRSSLRMLCRVIAFCRLLRPVLLLVSFPRSRSPVAATPPPLLLCPPTPRQRRQKIFLSWNALAPNGAEKNPASNSGRGWRGVRRGIQEGGVRPSSGGCLPFSYVPAHPPRTGQHVSGVQGIGAVASLAVCGLHTPPSLSEEDGLGRV